MFKIVFHPTAQEELNKSVEWYNIRKQKLGLRFRDSVTDTISKIYSNPLAYAIKSKDVYREAKVKFFPFVIVYRIYPRKKVIFVSSVFHTSRNPRKKFRKP